MPDTRRYDAVIDEEFLPLRAKILELAAGLDRLARASGAPCDADPRPRQLTDAIRILLDGQPHRAERVQLLCSRPYEPQWRQEFAV